MYLSPYDLYVLGFFIFCLIAAMFSYRHELKKSQNEVWELRDKNRELLNEITEIKKRN